MIRRAGRAAAVAAAALLLFAAAADARQAAPGNFDGACELDGVLSFTNPIGAPPTSSTWSVDASGPCNGTLNGQTAGDEPVRMQFGGGPGDLSCLVSLSPGGPGTFTFSRGTRQRSDDVTIAFEFGEFAAVTVKSAPWTATGAVSGELVGQSSFPLSQDLVDSCNAGTLSSVVVHLSLHTIGPFVG